MRKPRRSQLINSASGPSHRQRRRFRPDLGRQSRHHRTAFRRPRHQHFAHGPGRRRGRSHRSSRCDANARRGLPRGPGRRRPGPATQIRFRRSSIPGPADFRHSLATFLHRLFTGRIRTAEIEAEISAQIAVLQQRGVRLTHVDTHKHTHVFSAVLRPLLRAARAAGIRALRNPFEPHWSTRATRRAHWMRLAQVGALRWLEPHSRRIIEQAGFLTTCGTVAVAGTGILDAATLRCFCGACPAVHGNWLPTPATMTPTLAALALACERRATSSARPSPPYANSRISSSSPLRASNRALPTTNIPATIKPAHPHPDSVHPPFTPARPNRSGKSES